MPRSNNEQQDDSDSCRILWAIICCPCFSVYYLIEKIFVYVVTPCCTYLSKCLDYFCSKILEAISKTKMLFWFVLVLYVINFNYCFLPSIVQFYYLEHLLLVLFLSQFLLLLFKFEVNVLFSNFLFICNFLILLIEIHYLFVAFILHSLTLLIN